MQDGRVKAETTINGKSFEAFGSNEREASLKLEQTVDEAATRGEVPLQG